MKPKPTKEVFITPSEYNILSDEKKFEYDPVYGKYKETKHREYCDECGHFTRYSSVKNPIGNPTKYVKLNSSQFMWKTINKMFVKNMQESFFSENVLANKLLKRK